ncbi:hypothetical protein V4762_03670 [Thermodesulfobium sp. 4217-1]|uniref:hypothetical protein n=1 Tax=Thermodesulfobium sp. 4217-1 TaxID=3120013 RepID=UPI0032215D00
MEASVVLHNLSGKISSLSLQPNKTEENSYFLSTIRKIKNLDFFYNFEDYENVCKFLLNNKDLITVLESSIEEIRDIFGNSQVFLEIDNDPEEEFEELFIVIKSNFDANKVIELKEKFFYDWFVKIIDKVGNRLNFTVEPYEL